MSPYSIIDSETEGSRIRIVSETYNLIVVRCNLCAETSSYDSSVYAHQPFLGMNGAPYLLNDITARRFEVLYGLIINFLNLPSGRK